MPPILPHSLNIPTNNKNYKQQELLVIQLKGGRNLGMKVNTWENITYCGIPYVCLLEYLLWHCLSLHLFLLSSVFSSPKCALLIHLMEGHSETIWNSLGPFLSCALFSLLLCFYIHIPSSVSIYLHLSWISKVMQYGYSPLHS